MDRYFGKYFFCVLLLGFSYLSYGQKEEGSFLDFVPSENIDAKKDFNNKSNAPKRKSINFIVKNDTEGFLYGNPCMIEETHRMGFEYSIQVPGLPGSIRPWKRFWRNLVVSGKLILTRGPWWKLTLNSRVKDCRKRSGDLVG